MYFVHILSFALTGTSNVPGPLMTTDFWLQEPAPHSIRRTVQPSWFSMVIWCTPTSTASTCEKFSAVDQLGSLYEYLVLPEPRVSVHLVFLPASVAPVTSSINRVSISRLFVGPTLKLSVLVCRGTKPCKLPGAWPQSTALSPLATPRAAHPCLLYTSDAADE